MRRLLQQAAFAIAAVSLTAQPAFAADDFPVETHDDATVVDDTLVPADEVDGHGDDTAADDAHGDEVDPAASEESLFGGLILAVAAAAILGVLAMAFTGTRGLKTTGHDHH